jgi:hypothetical protein
MRFFKYLISIFFFFCSSYTYAAQVWYFTSFSGGFYKNPQTTSKLTSTSAEALCTAAFADNNGGQYNPRVQYTSPTTAFCLTSSAGGNNLARSSMVVKEVEDECWYPDYKIVTQPITGQLKKSICIPNNGVMCKYTTSSIDNLPIVNGSITTTFSSVSKTPAPNCKEELLNPPCDPKDPYGGCYTPPNQECTRQFDGSIVCPEEKKPPIQKGCNGADYCNRPPQGCGEGYVSGTYNGQRICIRTKPSSGSGDGSGTGTGSGDGSGSGTGSGSGSGSGTGTGSGDGSGSGTGSGDGSGSGTGSGDGSGSGTGSGSGSGSGTGSGSGSGSGTGTGSGSGSGSGKDVDSDGIIGAINKLRDSLIHYSKEITESIDSMSKKITGKIDDSNVHLDQIEANTLASKNNSQTTNDLLQQIKDKIRSDSSSQNPPTGDGVDLTETNGLLGEIRDGINHIKNVFSDEGKGELEQIGQASNDSRYLNAEANAQSAVNALANKLTFGSSACVSDFEIQLPIFGSINIALSQWCSLLALIKILFQLVVLLTCLRMLDATVRTI